MLRCTNLVEVAYYRQGAVAQLGEHLLCKQGVRSSSLLSSTKPLLIETNNPCMEIMVKPKRSPENTFNNEMTNWDQIIIKSAILNT